MPLTWVSGEISNFTRASSGHWYFTLKDNAAQVRAVMFRGRAQYADFQPREGDKVEVRALVTLYAPRGDYQLSVEAIRRAGVGNLYEAFLRLKAQLTQEGLFDPERKRALPVFPKTVGIVTSPQAAALRDILTALRRRAPHVNVILYPTPVQGDGAGNKIAQAIATAADRAECDVLLVCRGGGSIEDLWAFNEEIVARTIAHSPIPVIAGIGHETDFTIADFAADLRAATPTAAAEQAVLDLPQGTGPEWTPHPRPGSTHPATARPRCGGACRRERRHRRAAARNSSPSRRNPAPTGPRPGCCPDILRRTSAAPGAPAPPPPAPRGLSASRHGGRHRRGQSGSRARRRDTAAPRRARARAAARRFRRCAPAAWCRPSRARWGRCADAPGRFAPRRARARSSSSARAGHRGRRSARSAARDRRRRAAAPRRNTARTRCR